MPKRKERMAGYIRESDPTLLDSATIESAAKAVRLYGEKEGYSYDIADHEYREALSAYTIPYMERPQLLAMLAAAKRREFDVLVITEVRALSRRQVEVFILYDMLQKYGVRLETIQEKFEDSAMGRLILSLRAFVSEVERENIYMRLQRGKKDRLENGAVNGHPKPAYGYVFVDSEREIKAYYAFKNEVVFVDREGTSWTEGKVVLYIFDLAKHGMGVKRIAITLNELGFPPPKKPYKYKEEDAHWQPATVHRILCNRMYIGEVWANKYKREKGKFLKRPIEEQYLLPEGTAPALIDKETFEAVQKQLAYNKQDSLRNNKHPKNLGILRAGYVFCGICGRRMVVAYHNSPKKERYPDYVCRQVSGQKAVSCNHLTSITVALLDRNAWEKILEALKNPAVVRAKVAELREKNIPPVDTEAVEATLETIKRQMHNLFELAKNATDEDTISTLGALMKDLEKQKREAESFLYGIAEDDEEREAVEAEIVKFEQWVAKVKPLLTDPSYTPTYEERRLCVRILGVKAIVFPTKGEHPHRVQVDITIPDIKAKIKHCVTNQP